VPTIDELNAVEPDAVVAALKPFFEGGDALVRRLVEQRPFEDDDELFGAARAVARGMPEPEQVDLLNAHPRIGADPATVSPMSRSEQGYDRPPDDNEAWVANELAALNEAYEGLFGFRFVVFVAGRPRADIIPILEHALRADRDEELRRGLDDVVLIARDRWDRARGPRPMPEELRESVALEASRHMVGELDRAGLVRSTHRLIEEGVESPALLALSLADADADESGAFDAAVRRLLAEIGLPDWDHAQAGQLLALHAAASVIGEVSQPIDGARRIASVSGNASFHELATRWESAEPEARADVDADIRRAAAELFGPPEMA
jgi:2-oxo-4-hydroxy-4-carboxy-5-ureidoimidazoline decarboxylase